MLHIRPYIISGNAAGLCNQLSFLINAILYCSKKNIKQLIISDFISDNKKQTKIKCNELLNLTETNNYLRKFNVEIVDSKLINSNYNYDESNNKITLYTDINPEMFNYIQFYEISRNLVFNEKFYTISNNLIPEIKLKLGDDIKINVIHLRIEDDALLHWSKMNKMNINSFKTVLENRYISLIKHFINKKMFTIVMTYSANNNVIRFLSDNNYNFYINKKNLSQGRECNALIDLLLSRKMNNFFIGAIGSTFSHFILNMADNKKKSIMIDINNIKNTPNVTDF
jgi:hypothetical protein